MIPLLEQLLEKEDIFKPFTFEEWADRMVSAGIWTRNSDNTYSAEGDVNLSDRKLTKLPIKFKEVGGFFDCRYNQLTSLEGSPEKVGEDFWCGNNQLTSLEGSPKEVGRGFYCSFNRLTSLEGAPQEVGGDFWCDHNQLTTLEGAPQKVGGSFYCSFNKLTTLKGIGIVRGNIFCSNNPVPEEELLKTIGRWK
jgi:hypothetical protein